MVDLTVALPIYKGKHIFWLAMESLCRQKEVNCSWELLVAEEQIEPFAGEEINSYFPRLNSVGCERIRYFPLKQWIPLSQKWALLGKHADSKMFVCQADDNYAQPYRLKETYENIDKDYICCPSCLFYFIANHTVYKHTVLPYRRSKTAPGKGLHYSFQTKYAKKIPSSDRAIIVDQWIYDFIKTQTRSGISHKWIVSDHWKEGFNTHGFHRLSKKRYTKHKNKVVSADKYSKNWPEDIVDKLKTLQGISEL